MKTRSTRFYHVLLGLITGLFLSFTSHANVILVHGDSLSAGYGLASGEEWPALLQKKLSETYPHYKVVNSSLSGETTHGGLARFDAILAQHQPTLMVLELGANDGLRGQSIESMRLNLEAMISKSRAINAKVLLLGVMIPPNYGTRYSQAFHAVYHRLAQDQSVPLVPFFLDGVAGNKDLMQQDGLHPKAEAQPIILENIWKTLEPLLQKTP